MVGPAAQVRGERNRGAIFAASRIVELHESADVGEQGAAGDSRIAQHRHLPTQSSFAPELMTAVLAVAATNGGLPAEPSFSRMLGRMRARGSDRVESWRDGSAALGVSRYDWESSSALAGASAAETRPALIVAADATLYYQADLHRRLASAGVAPAGRANGDLIAAAYRAWGDRCVDHLEGDYAFVVWDAERRRVFCARDFMGSRSLYYAGSGESFVAASTIGAILEHPAVHAETNIVAIGETVSALFAASHETAYMGILSLPAGHTLTWDAESGVATPHRFWTAPEFLSEGSPETPFDVATGQLRELLIAATAERMAPAGVTSISLSGGYDSPAVFGAAQPTLQQRADAVLRAVSISYPHGDLGREDELIDLIVAHWNTSTGYIDIGDIPMFDRVEERAAERDEPFCHGFENFNRALPRLGRDLGARVMLNGNGGDQLFHVEPVYLADLLRRGRLFSVMGEWRATGVASYRELFRWAVLPLMGARSRALAARMRGGRPLRGYLDQMLPPWVRQDFATQHHLLERELQYTPKRESRDAASFERTWILTHPFYARITAEHFALSLAEGVEQRAPLFDGRLVAFAATRPRTERRSKNETKRLLRAAVRDLLPEQVLAPRRYRTGTTITYFGRSFRSALLQHAPRLFRTPVLADLGIVEPKSLQYATDAYLRGDAEWSATALMYTLHTELWLRARAGAAHVTPVDWSRKQREVA